MRKNTKLLMSFLAVNAVVSSYTGATTATIKYDKMYDKITKNLKSGKSNDENYKLIEKVLNKRNKELKDLYIQGDYIVKPEYLEWQIFFSGFYSERNGGDNTFENAELHSDPNYQQKGYYNSAGEYIITEQGKGKPYAPAQEPREINLGTSIPMKGITREDLNLSISPVGEININPGNFIINTPTSFSIPPVNPVSFQPVQPVISLPSLAAIPLISIGGAAGANSTGYTGFYATGDPNKNSIFSQMDLTSGTIEANTSGVVGTYSYTLANVTGQAAQGTTLTGSAVPTGTYTGSVTGTQAILKTIDNAVSRYGADITLGGGVATPSYLEQILHYDEHYTVASYRKTIDQLVSSGYISATEGNEFASKYLDTSIGDTRTNKFLQYAVNTGEWNLKGNSILAMNIQSHSASSSSLAANIAFENKGSITGLYESVNGISPQRHIAFMFTEGANLYRYQVVDNSGLVEMRAPESVAYSLYNVSTGQNGKFILMNNNEVKLYGKNNVGIYTRGQVGGSVANAQIKLFTPITVLGDESIGVDIERQLNFANSKIKVDVGTEDTRQATASATGVNGLENSGESGKTGYSNLFTDNGVGIYINMTSSPAAFTLKDYEVNIGEFSQNSIGLRVGNGNVTLGNNIADITTKHSIISDGGIGNILVAGVGTNSIITVASGTNLELKNGNSQVGLYANTGSSITNAGILTASGDGTKGVVVDTASTFTNTGSLDINGGVYTNPSNNKLGTVGIAVRNAGSSFTSTAAGSNVTVDVSGKESTGLFTDTGTINIANGNIKTSDGAFNLYSKGSTGKITLSNSTLEAGQRSLLFYNETGGTFNLNNVNATVTGATNATDRGTSFYYVGVGTLPALTTAGLSSYFSTVFNNTAGNLTLNMDSGSRLFIVDNVSIDLSVTATPLGTIAGGPTVNGSDYKTYMMYKSLLGIDQAVNLDSSTDAYHELEIATSSITNNGQTITGTLAGQAAIAQENGMTTNVPPTALPRSTVTLTNNGGIFSLSGANSVGMYASNGEIYNKAAGKVNTTGDNSIGIYATNGTKVETFTGTEINIGKNGVGIFAEGYKQGAAQVYGNGELDIKNNGLIKAGTGNGAFGIYLNNNSGVPIANSKLDLSTGTVDMTNSEGGIAIFANKGTVIDSGSTITVGKNGIGLYANDSNVNLSGSTINLNGDNALGLYLDGTTSFLGTGTINISGQNTVLFNMASSGTVSNNFNVGTVAAGSSYTLGNIINGIFEYTGASTLASNGTLVSGVNSAVFLNGSSITANSGAIGVAAIALDGQYTGSSSLPSGMSSNIDGENNGSIVLGDSSVGLYGKNDSRLSNLDVITMGDNSAGMMTSGVNSLITNNGVITLGSGSQGMFLKDGTNITNSAGASIISTGTNAVGIYADNISAPILNDGTIQLLGDKSIGIYTKGASIKTINNTGTIEVGNSTNISDPSIGVFSDNAGDTITNSGTITSGVNSIGIYSEGGTINQNGISNIGDSGVGLYSSNGTVNINGTSAFNFGTNRAVGVYATNSAVTNGATMNIGNNNYGFVLTNGTFINNASNITLDNDSVFVYRSGLGSVTNGAGSTVTMNGSNNIGYYIVNGGNITNNGIITGTIGSNNVGIYNTGGNITNTGTVSVGASDLQFITDVHGKISVDAANSKYAVGLYGENSTIINSGTVNIGAGGIGITTKGGTGTNTGTIIGTGDYTRGMYTEGGTITNTGAISITGNDVMGMAGNGAGSNVINSGTIIVTGDRAIGIFGNLGAIITNSGTITATGSEVLGIVLSQGATLNNTVNGVMIINGITSGNFGSTVGITYPTPTIINSGVIKIAEKFETDGINVIIKVDPSTVKVPTSENIASGNYNSISSGAEYLISNAVHFEAPSFNITAPLQISGNFAEGTNVGKYKLEDIIIPDSGHGIDSGIVPVMSKSLTWRATPVSNNSGNVDIWMEKIAYNDFTDGLWFEDFGRALDSKYIGATGDAMAIYDKIDMIESEKDFRHLMAGLAGNVYANLNQREEDVANAFENSLNLLQDSKNNTKENVKINIIVGKGKNKEDTDGVVGYDYSTAGVLGLREVERTYKHTFGYSLGYLHTGFEFNDGNNSEEWVDTVQLGVHNKYKQDDWTLKNDLTGRVSMHNIDRNVDWASPTGRSEMNGIFETYSITSDNKLGKEILGGKNGSITPYAGIKAMYVTRPSFEEEGLEKLQVEGNDAWSVKPKVGIELKASTNESENGWKLKGTLDFSYEYELADLNEREKARLVAIEDGYHDLSKPEDEKGTFKTKASVGVEVEDRYGIFLTGEYSIGNNNEDDYRAGVTLKAVF